MLLDALLADLAVNVEPFALCQLSPGWRLRLPERADATVHFVLEGRGAVRTPSGSQPVGPYWLVVVPPGTRHHLEAGVDPRRERRLEPRRDGSAPFHVVAGSEDDAALRVACGAVRVRYGISLGLFDHLREALAVDLAPFPDARRAIEGILAEQARPGGSALAAALMTQCLVYLLRSVCGGPQCSLPWLSALEDPRLARAVDRILAHPEAHHSVESLAASAAMSRSAFAEAFAGAFGRTPMALVHHVRMQRAFRLLSRERSLSVDEVAERVGYSSRSHFSRAFKRHHGMSPAACRDPSRPLNRKAGAAPGDARRAEEPA